MEPVIEADGLTKYYGEIRGVEDLTFAVEQGEAFGYLGPNGAGKTTTIRTLMGFLRPTAGTATVLGADVHDRSAHREVRRRLGYLAADPGLDEDATGRELIRLHAGLRDDERSDELVDLFDVPVGRPVADYSRGNRQKLAIVLAFMHEPDLAVMDEPTSGLDPLMQERFYEFLADERDRGATLFFSSHVLSEVRRVCDRVGIVRDGRFVTVESVDDLLDRAGKQVRLRTIGPVDPAEFAFEGVHDLVVGETTQFTFTGSYDDLVAALGGYDIVDLEVREAPLEDVFMRFYGEAGTDGIDADAGSDGTAGGKEEGEEVPR